MPFDSTNATSLKILTAAESLFAEYGCHGVSLRQITAKARVNLAAINYYYTDKQTLYRDIILYRLRQINVTRLTELSAAEARSGDLPLPMEEIIMIMARPLFQPSPDLLLYNLSSMRLLGRILTEGLSENTEIIHNELQPAMTRFGQAIRRHLPRLSPPDFVWQMNLVVGAMHHALATSYNMTIISTGICRNDDSDMAYKNFTGFAIKALSQISDRW